MLSRAGVWSGVVAGFPFVTGVGPTEAQQVPEGRRRLQADRLGT